MSYFKGRGLRRFLGAVLILAATATTAQAQLLSGANWFEREVGKGVTWRYYQFDDLFSSKQSISYMEVDLDDPDVDFQIRFREAAVGPSPPAIFPRAPTSTFAGEVPGAKAAINGTYFNTKSYDSANPTTPWGGGTTYLKVDGTTVHAFDGTNVNTSGMGILYNTKNDVTFERRPESGGWTGIDSSWQNMMICGPVLLKNGVVETYAESNTHATARHPRSAVGITSTNKLILLAVDGRTSDAAGMSCTELAQVIKELGAVDAINLDGGGSTTLWAAGEPYSGVVNFPSDNGTYDHLGQRSAANALIVTSTAPTPAPWDGRLNNITYDLTARSGDPYTVTLTYTNIGTETWTPGTVKVVPSRALGRTSSFIPAGQENTFFAMSPTSVATGQTATFTLTLTPPEVAADTAFIEHFALSHSTLGYFGPADNEARVTVTVRPSFTTTPPPMIVQGGSGAPNSQWYEETSGSWSNSSVSFTAPGVYSPGSQRYVGAGSTGRSARFAPVFELQGFYKVSVAFPASTNSIAVRYDVNHLGGTSSFTVDQNQTTGSPNEWVELGTFEFGTGTTSGGAFGAHSVVIGNPTTTGNRFYSGAVLFEFDETVVQDWEGY
ncbi:MAG: hypothetical protein PWP23_2432 [Candidatus Sumerlaeota bacterium]|nr:hypothetical protein [Candidatus Sumerlaeota bacterium]